MLNNKLTLLFLLSCFIFLTTCKKVEKFMMITTGTVNDLTDNTAIVSGQIVDIGEGATQYGHYYSTIANETSSGLKTQLGNPSGKKEFTSQLTGLTPEKKYYIKAYISKGTEILYGKEINFTTPPMSQLTLTTSAVENATPSILEMTFNLTLANIVPSASAFTVLVNSAARTVSFVAISGTKVQLTLASAIISNDVITVTYTKPTSNPLQTASSVQAATITPQPVTNNVLPIPVYVSSVVENATPSLLEMTYNLSLAYYIPAASAFTVMVNSSVRTVNTVTISGTKVQLTLASAIINTDVITVAYTKPGSNPLQATSGGQAITITAQSVTNNVGAITPPVYVSSVVENATPTLLEMTYNLSLVNIVPAPSAFTVMVNSAARTVNTIAIVGAKVQLTLASPVVYGDIITVAYTKPASNPLQTAAGGQAATITAQTVTNNIGAIPLPVYVSSVVENATPSLLEMTYNLSLAIIIPASSAFTVMVNSAVRTVNSVAISGTKVQLTLASAIINGDVITVTYTKPGSNPLQTTLGGQAITLTAQTVINNVLPPIPVYVSSVVENATPTLLEMTYNLSLANIVPAASAFTVMVNSAARTVNSVAISGTKVQLTLASAIINGDVITVAYSKPGSNPLQTPSGGQAITITAQTVTNNVLPVLPVYLGSVVENATPTLLEMTYSLSLANIIPAASAFTVMVNSSVRAVNTVTISGTKVQLTLASAIINGDVITVAYTKPGSNPLQTPSGGQAITLTAQTVTNNVLPSIPIYMSSVVQNATPGVLEMIYNSTLANIIPAASAFTVQVNSVTRTVMAVAISGTKVMLTLASAIIYGDIVTVAYTRPASNPLQTSSGGQAATFTVQVVTNNCITVPSITTTTVTSIALTTAVSGGNIAADGGGAITARGVCWATTANPTISNNITTNGTGTGSFTSNLSGLLAGTTYYIRAYATNGAGTAYGNQYSFNTRISDVEGNTYNTVTIGTQIWMAENLKTIRFNDNTPIPNVIDNTAWAGLTTPAYCWYNNDGIAYKNVYGALYNWYAVDAASNGGKNICPTGWHPPSDSEWTILTDNLGGLSVAGDRLKEGGTTHWLSGNNSTNSSGFTAIPGGDRSEVGVFSSIRADGTFWSSSSANAGNSYFRSMSYNVSIVRSDFYYKQDGFSVRCIKD